MCVRKERERRSLQPQIHPSPTSPCSHYFVATQALCDNPNGELTLLENTITQAICDNPKREVTKTSQESTVTQSLRDNPNRELTNSALENIDSRYFNYIAIIPTRSNCTMRPNYPGAKLLPTAFKLRTKI